MSKLAADNTHVISDESELYYGISDLTRVNIDDTLEIAEMYFDVYDDSFYECEVK